MGLFDRLKKTFSGENKAEKEEQEKLKTDQEIDQDVQEIIAEDEKNKKDETIEDTEVVSDPVVEVAEEKSLIGDDQKVLTTKTPESKEERFDQQVDLDVAEIMDQDAKNLHDEDIEETEVVSDPIVEVAEEKSVVTEKKADEEELYQKGLAKTNKSFGARLNAFFAKFRSVDEKFFEDLEELLIESDVGYETAMEITDSLRDEVKLNNAKSQDDIKEVIVKKMVDIYEAGGNEDAEQLKKATTNPTVYLFVGVNGAGKTTTVGKLAAKLKQEGNSVLLVAADTFRAGAVAQLQEWGKRVDVPVVAGAENADPASVVYTGIEQAISQNADYVLVDTAGRLQNKVNLMNELDKINRTIKKLLPKQPTETLLVIDGSTGQNALIQAKEFNDTTTLTGLVLTKIDGSSKGGVVLAIRNEMNLPVKLVGLGESAQDLADFDAEKFAEGLFHGLI